MVERLRTIRGRKKWDGVAYLQLFSNAVLSLARGQVRELDVTVPTDRVETVCQVVDRLETDIVAALDRSNRTRETDNAQKARAPSPWPRTSQPADAMGKHELLMPPDDTGSAYVVVRD